MPDDAKVKSLYRALQVLECFSPDQPELGITEISHQLGYVKSNVSNIVATFVKAGYLEQNRENGKFRLGFKILHLGSIISGNIGFRTLILPYMQRVADAANEIVYLAVPRDEEVVYLDSCGPKNIQLTRSMLGIKAQMHCTGIGKAMLASLPEATVQKVLARPLKRYTENTITDSDALVSELIAIRQRGYSIDQMEHEFGIKCVGMPIRNRKKEVVAGLSISGPSLRFSDDKIEYFASLLFEAVKEIEDKL